MELLSDNDLEKTRKLHIPEGPVIVETLLQIIKYKRLNKVYSELHDKDPVLLINSLLEELELKYDIPEEDLKNIPPTGSLCYCFKSPFQGN